MSNALPLSKNKMWGFSSYFRLTPSLNNPKKREKIVRPYYKKYTGRYRDLKCCYNVNYNKAV